MQKSHLIPATLAAALWLAGVTLAAADDTLDEDDDAPAGAESGQMQKPGDMGGRDMTGRMGRGARAKMHGAMMARQSGPTVVINIYPGGAMTMSPMSPMGMMGSGDESGKSMGMMGHGKMGHGKMGHGKMGHGMMHGMKHGGGERFPQALSAPGVRAMMEDHLAEMGRDQLKVGAVEIIDEDLAGVYIVDANNNEPDHRMVINRHTGAMMRAN
ncbi:MAG: hypothetical protein QF926_11525 [Alphaproteobacteria bacterium]|jgi:hypothetical protein|nr:hypothetical protein [Alphaproteobacteria bacterium]